MAVSILGLAALAALGAVVAHARVDVVSGPFVLHGTTGAPLTRFCTPGTPAAAVPLPSPSSGGPGGMPKPGGFQGLTNTSFPFGGDISGAAGPNDYVETINSTIGIFTRQGKLRCPQVDTGTLWKGLSSPCNVVGFSDAVVLFDQRAGKWLITRFASDLKKQNPDWFECIAVSETSDPTGAYFRYTFPTTVPDFLLADDYPKLGIWRDGYYMTSNARTCCPGNPPGLGVNEGIWVTAFERSAMLQGHDADEVEFFWPRNAPSSSANLFSTMQPASIDGANLPPAGTPEFLVQPRDDNMGWHADQLAVWNFHVDWSNPSSSKLRLGSLTSVSPFDSNVCEPVTAPPTINQFCIKQRGTADTLDPLAYGFSGYRLVYRRFTHAPTHLMPNDMVFAQTVAAPGNPNQTAIRWYILGQILGHGTRPWRVSQQGTYSPDGNDRWLPSPGMDAAGDVAIGFNVSGSKLFPSVRFVGRRVTDAPNKLPRHEATEALGGGPQNEPAPSGQSPDATFGDYNQMVMDPTDDCRFWFAASFYKNAANGTTHKFSTAVGSFRFSTCS